jgi:predicted secreted hydrolase
LGDEREEGGGIGNAVLENQPLRVFLDVRDPWTWRKDVYIAVKQLQLEEGPR